MRKIEELTNLMDQFDKPIGDDPIEKLITKEKFINRRLELKTKIRRIFKSLSQREKDIILKRYPKWSV